ncbi:MAG: DUF3450 family protein [Pseudomonadota bacterium]
MDTNRLVNPLQRLRRLSAVGALVFLCLCLAPSVLAQESNAEDVDALTSRWVAIENQRTAIAASWREQQRNTQLQIDLLRAERTTLQNFLDSTAASNDEIDARRAELVDEQQQLEQRDEQLRRSLDSAIDQMSAVHTRLPPPLQDAWSSQLDMLQNTEISPSERLAGFLGLMQETVEFEQRIALHNTRMVLAGKEYQVQQIYLGLSHGWYINEEGSQAGIGRVTAAGWSWVALDPADVDTRIALQDAITNVQARGAMELSRLPISIGPQP